MLLHWLSLNRSPVIWTLTFFSPYGLSQTFFLIYACNTNEGNFWRHKWGYCSHLCFWISYLLPVSCMVISVIILGHLEQWRVWNKLAKASHTENKPKTIQWRCKEKNKAQMTSVCIKHWVPQAMGWRHESVQWPSIWTGLQCFWFQESLCETHPVSQHLGHS